jgi:3-oxoacyl-[acyl-carrier protein] reductase
VSHFSLQGKVAIVTGGAGGLGLAIANVLLASQATVIIFDYDAEKLNRLDAAFHKELVDLTNEQAVQDAVNHVVQTHHHIDILINNAGVIHNEVLINLTKKERKHDYVTYKRIIDINMNAVFLLSSYIADEMMMKRTKGVIINVSSISAEGNAGQSAYSAAKAGVNAFTKTWAKELGPFGIRVMSIAPGFIETDSTKNALESSVLESIIKKIPLKRLGQANEVAHMVLTILQNSYMTGSVITVAGGVVI